MFEKQLTGIRRWAWLGATVMGVGFALLFGTLAIVAPAEFPIGGRIAFAAGALFGLGWAALSIRVFRRGSLDLKKDTFAATGLTWGFVVFTMTIFLLIAPETIVGLRMILSGLVFVVFGVAFLLRHVIEQSELKTREKLLEIEYRLADLAESLKPEKRLPPSSSA
jgi:hypothetical protein